MEHDLQRSKGTQSWPIYIRMCGTRVLLHFQRYKPINSPRDALLEQLSSKALHFNLDIPKTGPTEELGGILARVPRGTSVHQVPVYGASRGVGHEHQQQQQQQVQCYTQLYYSSQWEGTNKPHCQLGHFLGKQSIRYRAVTQLQSHDSALSDALGMLIEKSNNSACLKGETTIVWLFRRFKRSVRAYLTGFLNKNWRQF